MPPNRPSGRFTRRENVMTQRPLMRPSTGGEMSRSRDGLSRWYWKSGRSPALVAVNSLSVSSGSPCSSNTPMSVMFRVPAKAGATSSVSGTRGGACSA